MASSVNSLFGTSAPSTAGSSSTSNSASLSSAPSEGVFLQLLVSQLQNQDPLNPTDSTTFVSQLAQFSELEQVIGIRTDIEDYASANASSGSASTGQSSNSAGNPANTTNS